jgi:hypothetical protein
VSSLRYVVRVAKPAEPMERRWWTTFGTFHEEDAAKRFKKRAERAGYDAEIAVMLGSRLWAEWRRIAGRVPDEAAAK